MDVFYKTYFWNQSKRFILCLSRPSFQLLRGDAPEAVFFRACFYEWCLSLLYRSNRQRWI